MTNLGKNASRSKSIIVGALLGLSLVGLTLCILGLALAGSRNTARLCAPSIFEMQLPKWIGCAMATHEGLAGGLIAASGALFAAWLAWHAIMLQIDSDKKLATLKEDSTYEALRSELHPIADMLLLYWRVVDAAVAHRNWRQNGIALLRSLHPTPDNMRYSIDRDLAKDLDPLRRRQFVEAMQSLDWFAQQFERDDNDPLFLENVRTMLSHFDVYLRALDSDAAEKFNQRTKSQVDHRSMASHLEPMIEQFERSGNVM
jgi:hypothetical protein